MGPNNSPDTDRTISRRDFLRIASLAVSAVALARIPHAFALSAKRITIATAGVDSVYFALGGRIARTLTQYSGLETVAEITSGGANNCELVGSKRSDLALVATDTAYDAFRGAGTFEGKPVPIRVLTGLYPGMKKDIAACAVENLIVCHRDMENRSAYTILKIIFDHLREISTVHTQAKQISLKTGASLTALPYHPGAQKFFAEKGFDVPGTP